MRYGVLNVSTPQALRIEAGAGNGTGLGIEIVQFVLGRGPAEWGDRGQRQSERGGLFMRSMAADKVALRPGRREPALTEVGGIPANGD